MVSGDIQLLRSHLEGEGSLSKSERMKQGEGVCQCEHSHTTFFN